MRHFFIFLLILISISSFSQDRYNLFLLGNRFNNFFTEDNNLNNSDQIYYIEKESNYTIFCNEYLRFEIEYPYVNVKWFEEDEGTYPCEIVSKVDGQFYIVKFLVEGKDTYYYFYRRYDFLDKIWD